MPRDRLALRWWGPRRVVRAWLAGVGVAGPVWSSLALGGVSCLLLCFRVVFVCGRRRVGGPRPGSVRRSGFPGLRLRGSVSWCPCPGPVGGVRPLPACFRSRCRGSVSSGLRRLRSLFRPLVRSGCGPRCGWLRLAAAALGRCWLGRPACPVFFPVRPGGRCLVSAVVGFFGSRGLPSVGAAGGLVSRVVGAVVSSGRSVAVGCASGGDAAALSARLALPFPPSRSRSALSVFAVGGPGGAGFWRCSAVSVVSRAAALAVSPGFGLSAPVSVRWWAGGAAGVRLGARLAARSAALVRAVAAGGSGSGLVGFVSGGWSASPGSWRSVGLALAAGLPVVVFPVGCSVSCFPASFAPCRAWPSPRGVGPRLPVSWVPAAASGVWARGWRAVVAPAP